MIQHDAQATIVVDDVEPFTITYDLNGGTVDGNPMTYTERDTITLKNPTKENYVFVGWTGTDIEEPSDNVTIQKGSKGNRQYTAVWKQDSNIVILTFEILKNAQFGKTPITVSYDYDNYDVCNASAENVVFAIESGYVDVSDKKTGDVSGDGTVNGYDRLLLTRWLAKWREVLDGGIDETAADINCDGKINGLDRLILTRYLAHWEDYDLPYIK